ncbi:hypothetical protein WJX84_009076 [Apatococcus fuscideae]|uniref:Uncharacterized protein n=1 Tax=Apatococcus fuscideae TaxID=2026836 RepID=A0AAW1T5V5_9CHLO
MKGATRGSLVRNVNACQRHIQPPVESYRLEAAPCLSETGRLSSGPSALKGASVMAQIEACSDSQQGRLCFE